MKTLEKGQKVADFSIVELLEQHDENRHSYLAENGKKQRFILKLFQADNMYSDFLFHGEVPEVALAKIETDKLDHFPPFVKAGTITHEGHSCQYVVRKYIKGMTVAEYLAAGKHFTWREATDVICPIAYTLWKYNEMTGYIHNDICPENIIIKGKRNMVGYLVGLENLSYDRNMPTGIHVSELNRSYLAPEALEGRFSMQSDVFSLGVVLYQMLTGQHPWEGKVPPRLKMRITPQQKRAVMKAIELNKENRFINHVHFIKALLQEKTIVKDDVDILDIKDIPNENEITMVTSVEEEGFVFKRVGKGFGGFKEVAGMEELKQQLIDQVLFPLTDPSFRKLYGGHAINGMLLYGPPGCGKTYIAEKFAQESGMSFTFVKTSDLASIFVHGTQEKIGNLFKAAEKHAPCIICIDEIEGLITNRSNIMQESYAQEVNEFLTQLNNCSARGIFVIGTSNRPDRIDPAMLRKGRFDEIIYVPLPDSHMRQALFELRLQRVYKEDIDYAYLANCTEGYVSSDIEAVVNQASIIAAKDRKPVSQAVLEKVIKSSNPSVSPSQLRQYETIRNKIDHSTLCDRPKIGFAMY